MSEDITHEHARMAIDVLREGARGGNPNAVVTGEACLLRYIEQCERALSRRITLLDGTIPAVGQHVVLDYEACKRDGLAHAHDEHVHQITRFNPECWLIECGPTQISPRHLRLAPEGSVVTCRSCLGWSDYLVRLRADSEAYRALQVFAVFDAARKLIPTAKHEAFDREWHGLHEEATRRAGLSIQGSKATVLLAETDSAAAPCGECLLAEQMAATEAP